jgi:integrase
VSVTIRKVHRNGGKEVRFKAILRDRKGRALRSKTFTKLALAREWKKRVEADRELVEALGSEAGRITLRDVVRGDAPRRAPLVVPEQRQWQVDWWLARLGDRLLTEIRADDVRLALNEYANGTVKLFVRGKDDLADTGRRRSPATVNRMRAMLGTMYRHARVEWGLLIEAPLRAVPVRKEQNRRKVFLTEAEAAKLLAAARGSPWPKLYLLVLLGITTGARRGTLEALRWSDIDFDARTASLPKTKNGDAIVLTLPHDVADELKNRRELGDSFVFARPGHPYQRFESRKAWHAALRAAGLTPWKPGMAEDEGFRFHDLRHSAASFLAARGASLLAIGEVLGHRSTQTTKRYSHLLIGAKQKLTDEVFGDLFAKTRSAP